MIRRRADSYPDRADVYALVVPTGTAGGEARTYPTRTATGVPCRLKRPQTTNMDEARVEDSETAATSSRAQWALSFPPTSTALVSGDTDTKVVVMGQTLYFKGAPRPVQSSRRTRTVWVYEVEAEARNN